MGSPSPNGALYSSTVPVSSIDVPTRKRMLALMQICYEGVTAKRFHDDLDEKQFVIQLFAQRTRELVGFSTIRTAWETLEGRSVEVVFSGDTVIHPEYWGGKTLQAAFGRFVIGRKLSHPLKPVVWLLLSGGYKTYLLMTNNFPKSLPNRVRIAPPEWDGFASRVSSAWFGKQYDAAKGVVRFAGPHYKVKEGVAPVDRETGKRPDVAFYLQKNPGHAKGDELVCVAELRIRDLVRAFARIGWSQGRSALNRLGAGERNNRALRAGRGSAPGPEQNT